MSHDRGCWKCGADTMAEKQACAARNATCVKASLFVTDECTCKRCTTERPDLGRGGFTDGNECSVRAGDHVEYRFGARRGVLVEALQDGDAYVAFADTKRQECVKWVNLCKVPASIHLESQRLDLFGTLPVIASPPLAPVATPRRVVGFTGIAGSGKSEAAKHLIERHGFVRGKFAGALKEMMRTFLRYRGVDEATIERMIEGDLKEIPSPHLNGRTPRHAMQTLGTEWGRDCIHEELWIDTEMDAKSSAPAVVFDDVRYENECRAILAAGGSVVRVERAGNVGASTAEHSSETGVGDLPASLVIQNDRSLDAFLTDVSYILDPQPIVD